MSENRQIKIEVQGRIMSGDDAGSHVLIERDGSGGFLIYVTTGSDDGYDNWVKDEASLTAFFQEADWQVDWSAQASYGLEGLIRDRSLPGGARLDAVASLLMLSRIRATVLFLELAADEYEEETVARQVGELLGRIYFEDNNLYDVPLHDLTDHASDGFDDEVGKLQRRERG